MTIPNFLSDTVNQPGDYSESLSDVATIITTARTKLVTNGTWTEPSTALFKTPSDAGGLWFDVLLTAIDTDTLECRVRDKDANVVMTRRIDINAGATTVDYYWGNFHLVIVSRRATAEVFQAFLIDPTALADQASGVPNRVLSAAYRSTAGTVDSHSINSGNYWAWDNGAASQWYRAEYRGNDGNGVSSTSLVNRGVITSSGRLMNIPLNIYVNQAGTRRMTGALPCCLLVDKDQAFFTVRNGPLDGATTRKFIVLPLDTTTATTAQRVMIRKPSLDA
jgi:hypothetical protein